MSRRAMSRDQRKIVLVTGVGSHNGGAELMLYSCVEALGSQAVSLAADRRRVSPELLRAWGVGPLLCIPKLGFARGLGLEFIPRKLRQRYALLFRDAFAVLDASGYAYGDPWRAESILRIARIYQSVARRGAKVILLSQAFGPFCKSDVATATRILFHNVHRAYVRDDESFHHLTALLGNDERLQLSPDCSIGSSLPIATNTQSDRVAIVPNANIHLRSGSSNGFERYVASLTRLAYLLRSQGYEPFILIHSKQSDPEIAKRMSFLRPPLNVEYPQSGPDAKGNLSTCRAVVSGRYHALVSSLDSGIPVVAHSWSHKYMWLFQDFGITPRIADPFDPDSTAELLRDAIQDSSTADPHLSEALRAKNRHMWAEIKQMLGLESPPSSSIEFLSMGSPG